MEYPGPKVSILSAVFNEEQHIDEMITSLFTQSLREWEALFVDDGSTDRTAEKIKAASAADARIRLVSHGKKLGKVKAFNHAYAAATGDLFVLCGGDDRLPQHSLQVRYETVGVLSNESPAVGFFKLRTFSDDKKFDGIVLPRGKGGNRSGGSIAMNRALGDRLFPIDESLVSEDIWLGYASSEIASTVIDQPEIVLDYRIHPGNSNPRNRSFADMDTAIHARHRAWLVLAECPRLNLTPTAKKKLKDLWAAEQARHAHETWHVVCAGGLPLSDRAALASMSRAPLFTIRTLCYGLFSGWRGR